MSSALPRLVAAPLPLHRTTYDWSHAGRRVQIAVRELGGRGPAWLLLPAISTISSRREWEPFSEALLVHQRQDSSTSADAPRLISIDWPGFGDSDRLRLPYDAELLARFVADFRRDGCRADCGLIAAGHAAGISLFSAHRHGLSFREWTLVAPTWRGPFPTMAGRQSRAFPLIRRLVEAPLLGPLLYRLNTTRAMLAWMSRRHVDVGGAGHPDEGIRQRQCISRQPGARFASAAFVSGGLDPFNDPQGWIQAARNLQAPLTVVLADQAPPKSLAEMQALARVADRVLHLPGRLGAHEEYGQELAAMLA